MARELTLQRLPSPPEVSRRLDGYELLAILKHFRRPSLDELIEHAISNLEITEDERCYDASLMWHCHLCLETARFLCELRDREEVK